MADEGRFVGNSIEELLVALAEGVREAQAALNEQPLLDAAGRPLASYSLPYLDFTIAVEMTTQQTATGPRGGMGRLALLVRKDPGGGTSASSVKSTVAGRLIATPAGEGLPVPRLAVTVAPPQDGRAAITVAAANSAGELLAGQPIELNIDDAASARLSTAPQGYHRAPDTRLDGALLRTDALGIAQAQLVLGAGQQADGIVVVVVASIGAFSARGAIPLGAAA